MSPDFWSTNLELFKFKDLICIELGIAKLLIPAFLWHILKSIGKRFLNKRLKITLWIINYRAYYLWIIKTQKKWKGELKNINLRFLKNVIPIIGAVYKSFIKDKKEVICFLLTGGYVQFTWLKILLLTQVRKEIYYWNSMGSIQLSVAAFIRSKTISLYPF